MNLGNYFSNPIFTAIVGAVGGILFTLTTKFGEGRISEIYENRRQKINKRVEAARDINSFCVEGMHKGFRIKAGSEQHIKFRATEIEAIDLGVGTKLRYFLSNWSQYRNFLKGHPSDAKSEEMAEEYRDKAQKLGEELLEVARRWGAE